MSELLMLAERELVPELLDQAARVARVGDLVERRRILVPVLLRNHNGLLPQGFVEVGAHIGGDRVRRCPHRIGGGKAVRRVIKPAAKERRLDEPVPDAALLRGIEAGDDREESAEFLNRNRLPSRGRQPIEHDFHRVGVDHEPPAQRGGIADAKRDALVAEQEVRSIQAVIGDPRRKGALVVDRRAVLKAGPVHVDDGIPCASAISALRSSKASNCTSRPALRKRCATGIQNRVWYSASVVIRIVSDEAVMRGQGVSGLRYWQAASRSSRTVRAPR